MTTHGFEQLDIAINTPAGQITTRVEAPTGFIPVTAIVPLMHRLGQEAQALEVTRVESAGKHLSCAKGCAACCRMLVPLSIPETLAVRAHVESLPAEQRERIVARFAQTKSLLSSHGLWEQLSALCEPIQDSDEGTLETVNRRYYGIQVPCPFLEEELCTIYEHRPAACRELVVTTPAEHCADLTNRPVEAIAAPLRMSTVLGLLWQELTEVPARLIPLPLALEWAEQYQHETQLTWKGVDLVDRALDKVWRFLSQHPIRMLNSEYRSHSEHG